MSEVYRPPENEHEKEIPRENVLSTDDTKSSENLTRSVCIVEDFVERKEDDKIGEREDPSLYRGSISRRSSIISREDDTSAKFETKSESFIVDTSHDRITEEEEVMQTTKIDEVTVGGISHSKDDGVPLTREVIKETAPIAATRINKLPENTSSDKLGGNTPRNETLKVDGRKLKTATLDRVGRMFKSRGSASEMDKAATGMDIGTNIMKSNEKYGEQPTRKEKTNSLGRMFKLVDKDGTPKKIFAHPRAGSLSRIFRKHSTTETSETIDRTEEESPGIFSRMFNHLRGRSASSGNRSNPSNVREVADKGKASLPPKVPIPSKLPSGIPPRPPLSGSSSSSSAMAEKLQPTRSSQRTGSLVSYEP